MHGSEFVVGTLWAQLLLQFYTDPSETSQVVWSEDMHVVFAESWYNFFQIFHIFNLDFFFMLQYCESVYVVGTLWVQLHLQFYTIPTETIQMF